MTTDIENKIPSSNKTNEYSSPDTPTKNVGTSMGRWSKIGLVVLVCGFITLLALTIHFYKESRSLSSANEEMTTMNDIMTGSMKAEHDVLMNMTSGVGVGINATITMPMNTTNGTDTNDDSNRLLYGYYGYQYCSYMTSPRFGSGYTLYDAVQLCRYFLYELYSCPIGCPVSYTDAYQYDQKYTIGCYCGHFGKYDV